jgi:hypothetical protein
MAAGPKPAGPPVLPSPSSWRCRQQEDAHALHQDAGIACRTNRDMTADGSLHSPSYRLNLQVSAGQCRAST